MIATIIGTTIIGCIALTCGWLRELLKPTIEYISLEYNIVDDNGFPTQDVQLIIYDSAYFLQKNNSEIRIQDKGDTVVSITYSKPGYSTVKTNHNLYYPLNISLRKPKDE